MTARLNHFAAAPEIMKAFFAFSNQVADSGLEKPLIELVKIRASQINGCANCLNMHTYEARQAGETEQRLAVLSAWHEAPLFSDRERAALAWTECLTRLAGAPVPEAEHDAVRRHFAPAELVHLTLAVGAINLWNRLQVGLRAHPAIGALHAAA
jgi:AhpD family alkylhydroperoxidase